MTGEWNLLWNQINDAMQVGQVFSNSSDLTSIVSLTWLQSRFHSPVTCSRMWLPSSVIWNIQGMSFHDVMKLCFFNYSHPLLKKGWAKFVYKVHEIQLRNVAYFKKIVSLNNAPTSMVSWVSRVSLGDCVC